MKWENKGNEGLIKLDPNTHHFSLRSGALKSLRKLKFPRRAMEHFMKEIAMSFSIRIDPKEESNLSFTSGRFVPYRFPLYFSSIFK